MTWKDEFDKQIYPKVKAWYKEDKDKEQLMNDIMQYLWENHMSIGIKEFISTEIIEKLIEDIRGHKCRCVCPENHRLDQVIDDLRDKWLV